MRLSQVLAVIMALALGSSALAQRSVAPIQIDIGEWTFTPIAFGNVVESFVAFRDPATLVGDNIACVCFKSEAGGTWSAHAWRSQSRDNAAAHVMATLGIGAEQSDRWGPDIDPSTVPSPTAPIEIRLGLFVDDPLGDGMEEMPDRRQFLEMLVEIGWEATRIDDEIFVPDEDCDPEFRRIFLSAVADGVELALATGSESVDAAEELAASQVQGSLACIVICLRWTWKGAPTLVGCTCTPWGVPTPAPIELWGPIFVGGTQCSVTCWYEATATCTYTRTVTRRYWDCTRCTWTQTGTASGDIKKSRVDFIIPCNAPAPNFCAGGAPDDPSCVEPLGVSPGNWTPDDCPGTPQ